MKKVVFVIVVLFFSFSHSQELKNHTVAEGETITKIAQKYKVTPFDIYKLNPDAQNGIKPNMVLIIPKSVVVVTPKETPNEIKTVEVKKEETKPAPKNTEVKSNKGQLHTVKSKESLFGISKLYNVSIEDIQNNNPILKETGLQPGQVLIIKKGSNLPKDPASKSEPKSNKDTVVKSGDFIIHKVQPKETKYGIATNYGITVAELEKQNPNVVENLPIGYELKINKNVKQAPIQPSVNESPKLKEVSEPKEVVSKPLFDYVVKNGDTFYSLTKSLSITQEKLTELNPSLSDGLKEGMVLKVPVDLSVKNTTSNGATDLASSISKKAKKELVLLIPFNVSKIEMDTLKSLNAKLKDDKFLNMTLDFYSGAMMAIDSAKVLGLNVNVSIFDSEETKTTTTAVSTLQAKAPNVDAVIGPFFQANVEKVAQSLESKNVPVISPLSKEVVTSYSNLYNSMPSDLIRKKAAFDFMNAKNSTIIAIVEQENKAISELIKTNCKNSKWVGLTSKGSFIGDSIKKHFVKDKLNFVVLQSEKYYTIQTVISTMLAAMKDYSVQLVVLETNEMLDFEEISLNNLVKLKLTYPSLYKENESIEATQFEKSYRKKNKVLPDQFAVRGFDLTFDTMLRLSQEDSFQETILSSSTEQVESKFEYVKNINGGYNNKGVYILTYQPDLTIKEAK